MKTIKKEFDSKELHFVKGQFVLVTDNEGIEISIEDLTTNQKKAICYAVNSHDDLVTKLDKAVELLRVCESDEHSLDDELTTFLNSLKDGE